LSCSVTRWAFFIKHEVVVMVEKNLTTLLDPPLAHSMDPLSSFLAGEKHHRSGRWDSQKAAVLKALRQNDGSTSAELARVMDVNRYVCARRLPDLERAGLVQKRPPRQCKVTRSLCVVWHVVKSEPSLFPELHL